ncbi:hypothetical protein VT06_16125 [Arsukibacterium sp. MJ3]|uniref:helix-turn-helix transcriptional regulator n=1 Tax=Arsukibacterium sp. MJ3 TaxID=1632859 RepID=UPI0006271A37|nr:AlpA family phage regulatory protein [Arsukibacterium sp. MJ3]KKO47612.1 hypothetical protein VT06_16125 [Arsukibacterium sp. MJ3]
MQLLRLKEVLKIVPISKSNWYLMQKQPDAPKPIRLGPNTVMWYQSDIERWVQQQADKDWQT